jgi:hypothetical protein
MPLKIPVRAQGRDPDGTTWDEVATTADVASGGLSLVLTHPVKVGQCLLLFLPLPKRYRRYDLADQSYRIHVLVRSVFGSIPPVRVGVLFLGKNPPREATEPLPRELFLLPGDPRPERRQFGRREVWLRVTLERPAGPGQPVLTEETVAENLSKWGALVKTALPVAKGERVQVIESVGRFRSRAEIRNVDIGKDGTVRLNLLFETPVPDDVLRESLPPAAP